MKLPDNPRCRLAICLSFVVLAPLATATPTVCILGTLLRIDSARVTAAVITLPYLTGAVLGAAGAAAAALALPICHWGRITAAAICLIGVFFAFPAFCFLANEALSATFRIGLIPD